MILHFLKHLPRIGVLLATHFFDIHPCFFLAWNGINEGWCIGCHSKKNYKNVKKICLICFLCCALLVYSSGLFGSNEILEKIGNFSGWKNNLNDFNNLLLPYFSGCKNKRIKQKTNPTASKTKVFITLVDNLFRKQWNNITKNPISYAAGPLYLPLYLVF